MEPLSVTASITAILQLSSKVLGYLNDVKDASKDRAKCAVEASSLNSLLVSPRFRLEEGGSNQLWYTAVRALGVENGPLDQFKQALEHLQKNMTGGGRRKQVGDALRWRFSKEEVTSILARMDYKTRLLIYPSKLSQALKERTDMTHSNTKVTKNDTSFIRTQIPTIKFGLDTIQQDQGGARHDKLMGWISPTDYPAQQSDFIARRHQGTCQWFLDAPEFTKWLHGPIKTLFCPGIPGGGKTMMTAVVIDHLLEVAWSDTIGVVYVYCNYKARVDQNVANLLAAILKQLVQARPSIAEPVERLHKEHAGRGTKLSLEEIFGALQSVLTNYSSVYVAVDALDECLDRGTSREFLAKLRDLQRGIDLRILATSRFIPDIVDEFNAALTLEVRASDWDVKRFVAGQTRLLPNCIQHDDTLQDMVQEKIVQAVDGMFLLAQLYVNSLKDKRTKTRVWCTLERLSRGFQDLEKAYDDAIERIKDQLTEDSALATNVLSWIIYAERPLTTEEIRHALAVQPDDKELDLNNISDMEDILSVCAGLVTVDEESDIIRLVHYTAQEYFERVREAWNPRAQLKIALTCLTYLSFSIFESGSCPDAEELVSRLMKNPFLDYAAHYWGLHILTVQGELCELACSFLQRRSLVSCAMQVMSVRDEKIFSRLDFPKKAIGLHLTAQFGRLCLSKELLSRSGKDIKITINSKNSNDQTPLWVAGKYGHDTVVKLLLDRGAEVNEQCGSYGNVLLAASAKGHEQLVKLLFEKGAEVNVQGGHYGNALQAASARDHEQIVQLLLDRGAEVNEQGGYYGNALQAASARGHKSIVKLLLGKGASRSTGDVEGTATHCRQIQLEP